MFFSAWDASCLSFINSWYYTWNLYEFKLRIDVGKELGSLDASFDGSNYENLVDLLIGGLHGYTDGKVLGSDEGIKLGLSGDKVLWNILVNVDKVTIRLYVGTYLGSLYGSFDGSNYGNI